MEELENIILGRLINMFIIYKKNERVYSNVNKK